MVKGVAKGYNFPEPPGLFTIARSLGGWTTVNRRFFDPNNGIVAEIEKGIGSTDVRCTAYIATGA